MGYSGLKNKWWEREEISGKQTDQLGIFGLLSSGGEGSLIKLTQLRSTPEKLSNIKQYRK